MPAPGQPENASFPGEFIPSASGKKCDKVAGGWGIPMADYEYIWYGNMEQSTYPVDACLPYHHLKAKIDSLQVDIDIRGSGGAGALSINSSAVTFSNDVSILGNLNVLGSLNVTGSLDGTPTGILLSRIAVADGLPVKPFDIPHPSNGEGYRLRYVCLEGPEVGVYFRGRLTNKTEIELPLYWKDLVHIDSISVQLQPIGSHQDIIVKKVDEKKIYLQTNGTIPIDCYYHVYAERKDVERLIVEYEGTSAKDYPGEDWLNLR